MATTGIILIYADEKQEPLVQSAISDQVLATDDCLYVYDEGVANRITLSPGAMLLAQGGVSSEIRVEASSSSSTTSALLKIYNGAAAENITVAGTLIAMSGSTISGAVLTNSASMTATGSAITDLEVKDSARFNIVGGSLSDCSIGTSARGVLDGGVAVENLTIHAGSSLVLGSGVTLSGTVSIGGALTQNDTTDASAATVNFLLNEIAPSDNALLDWSKCSFSAIQLTVSDNQSVEGYLLAKNIRSLSTPISLKYGDCSALNAAFDEQTTYHNSVYALTLDSGSISLDVKDFETSVSGNTLSWGDINGADGYALNLSSSTKTASISVNTQAVDVIGLTDGDFTWQVRNVAEEDNWQDGEDFSISSATAEPQLLDAGDANQATDLFFAKTDGKWIRGYAAKHTGNKGVWNGTGETVKLNGKARITDVFAGSDDASILMLDAFIDVEDSTRAVIKDDHLGVALFVDDIYSNAPGTAEQARLSNIDTIIATDGADVIDLTSQRFEFKGGVTVYGGDGDDVIWANSDSNILFGGAGYDRIVGGSDDDIIIGGLDDDVLHGGGGNDIFCFGDNWGQDTVTQLSTGSVVLWFKENKGTWNENTMTYSCGLDSVTVTGTTSVELRFGNANEQYAALAAIGAFL